MKKSAKLLLVLSVYANLLLFPHITFALPCDFSSPAHDWKEIKSDGLTGKQKLLVMNDVGSEKIYLYWMAPGATTAIQKHSTSEEVVIVKGSLYWLNEDKSIQRKLIVGDYIDRKPGINHGPFKAGKDGCLMYVRFH